MLLSKVFSRSGDGGQVGNQFAGQAGNMLSTCENLAPVSLGEPPAAIAGN
ncbi:hypothetical protein [Thalassomonas haliotis]|uniref:Uncharacterized protein n=1 Tax=Thalassomonas haliotis TaxID=485448 RepID=A0ABY7VEV0_9GAMM|nr:hypothetical protein [Thalassomonas haliotis]WDE12244.1 hypothetical protein H3N35_01800 [Thalassomonas haliotis]